jgi:hypothetical protein
MGTEVDIRKITKYPPECFVSAVPSELTEGDNKVAEYFTPDKYVLSLYGVSFARRSIAFYADIDGVTNAVQIQNLSASRGIDYEEELKIPATKSARLRLYTSSSVSAFQWRHRIMVLPKTTALKILLGLPLTDRDRELDSKFSISDMVASYPAEPVDLLKGVEQIKSVANVLTSSGTLFRQVVPNGWKLILLDISVARPTGPATLYIDVERDDIETLHLDAYCLPSLEYRCPIRIVATDKIEITAGGACTARITYGLGRLTIAEKIRWGIDLTSKEREIADKFGLFDRVEAGVI